METILMDNGRFAEENNILPQLFPDEKRKEMASLFIFIYSEVHKDTELVQEIKEADLSTVDIGTKTCLLFNDTVRYMSQFENRESIYLQLLQQFENKTFESLLYSLPENNRQYDFDRYWKKLIESTDEIGFIKSKTDIDDNQLHTILSTMRKAHSVGNEKNISDNDLNNDIFKDIQQFRRFMASICTSFKMLFNSQMVKTDHHDVLITLATIETLISLNQDKYDQWFEVVGEKGVENQVKALSQILFESNNPDVIILFSFLQHLLLNSYKNGGDYQFTSFIHPYCNTMVKKMKFMEFLKSHPFGKDYCVEYKKYCISQKAEPLFNIDSIIGIPWGLERDNPSKDKSWYYKLNMNRFVNQSVGLVDEYNALSKLYDALIDRGSSPIVHCKDLFIYRFSGIYQKGAPIEQKFRLENKMEWKWNKKQILPVIIRLLYQEGKGGRPPYTTIASFFDNEDSKGFSSKCKNVGEKSLKEISAMLKGCGFTGFDDIYQEFIDEKEYSKKKHP